MASTIAISLSFLILFVIVAWQDRMLRRLEDLTHIHTGAIAQLIDNQEGLATLIGYDPDDPDDPNEDEDEE